MSLLTLPICPTCLRPIASEWTYRAKCDGPLCTPASGCPTWTTVAKFNHDTWQWDPSEFDGSPDAAD